MSQALQALLTGAIDYAGLFPPASLSLDQAIRNYARYRTEPEAWMLGRFIIPAARLSELSPYVEELFAEGPPLALSVLGRGGTDAASYMNGTQADIKALADFQILHPRARFDGFEMKPPVAAYGIISDSVTQLPAPFFECLADSIDNLVAAIKDTRGGVKLRCGGVEPTAFPTPEQIQRVLSATLGARLPIKFTAGLHHPVRRYDAGVGCHMHGFLNVYVAGLLTLRSHESAIVEGVLNEEDASTFSATDAEFRYHDHAFPVAEIESARKLITSFGSCSFDEPREDLRTVGLL